MKCIRSVAQVRIDQGLGESGGFLQIVDPPNPPDPRSLTFAMVKTFILLATNQ